MPNVKDVHAEKFIMALSQFLKENGGMKVPDWAEYVKTAHFKEASPTDNDWYFVRAAAIARQVYLRGATGVGMFKRIYGGKKRNGTAPNHVATGSGAVARSCLNNLETIKFVTRDANNMRILTSEGRRHMDRIATALVQSKYAVVDDDE
ncbi:30S ribosomal protein S19e [Thecamonas trahens ATCC 50062]|uniref:30S ribosomal protein S19e n=1 Tax=Thecamonas trahens ATCC 50062 TaxID=461836 RepID=A0A0L0DMV9_THETB|nr:30S ribosomal protein S19e [Thecamonas trahens ATCC 50062]KNC52753.1 30S ribosomal protein S19e [Thecamonas trahens ATCC 50062]|eukprot:XP_013755066.1 30S ribosomal protein S19e [Thecamonas trahens ATCC 50062]